MTLLLLAALAAAPLRAQEPSLIGSVVRSHTYTIRRGKHEVELLSGDVTYRQGGRSLRADRASYDHTTRRLQADGDIVASDALEDGRTISARGQRAAYDRRSGRGWLAGRDAADPVLFALSAPDGSAEGSGRARAMDWSLSGQEVSLRGGVWYKDPRGEAWAETARFLHGAKRLELSGRRPVLSAVGPTWQAAVQADRIEAVALEGSRRRVTGEGRARGWLHFTERGPIRP
ncbi:MAG: hypothetical protein KGL53_05300 [Elusimicrobia bacterium]|nr:hypothetical protein [Elusimicrobiota bacterium]